MRDSSAHPLLELVPYEIWNEGAASTVVGDLYVVPALHSPQLGNERDVFIHLPRSYFLEPQRRYPVLYAQDGQNLFDARRSYAGEWRFDETLEALAEEGEEWIVVGVSNTGHERIHEYSPIVEPGLSEGRGALYVRFLVETLKPLVDRTLRTLPGAESTRILGSSLGGLIALFAFFESPQTFGGVGAMSPSLQLGNGEILAYLARQAFVGGRIYLDVGSEEGARPRMGRFLFRPFARPYPARVRGAFRRLVRKGYRAGRDVILIQETGGRHNEEAWARRLPFALRFLYPEPSDPGTETLDEHP
jgi:predicted alpha/beta superfamily hydrolase